jgi:hypothetical protein
MAIEAGEIRLSAPARSSGSRSPTRTTVDTRPSLLAPAGCQQAANSELERDQHAHPRSCRLLQRPLIREWRVRARATRCIGTSPSADRLATRVHSPTSSGPVLRNGVGGGTIAFPESSRPDGPGADDRNGDGAATRDGHERMTPAVREQQRAPAVSARAR